IRMLGISMVMMPVTTAGLNQLPTNVIQHGTAMNNTLRQVAGAVGTALLVTVMTTNEIPEQGVSGLIHGVNVSFIVAGIAAVIALIMAFFIKNSRPGVDSYYIRHQSSNPCPQLLFAFDCSCSRFIDRNYHIFLSSL